MDKSGLSVVTATHSREEGVVVVVWYPAKNDSTASAEWAYYLKPLSFYINVQAYIKCQ